MKVPFLIQVKIPGRVSFPSLMHCRNTLVALIVLVTYPPATFTPDAFVKAAFCAAVAMLSKGISPCVMRVSSTAFLPPVVMKEDVADPSPVANTPV